MSIVFGIIGILGVAVVLLYCGYSKLKKIEIFMTFPEPKFPKINFHNVNSLVRESETFDELCVRKTAVTISKRTCSTDIDINKLTPEIFRDGCHSYLKNLETESTTEITVHFPEDKDELLDGPVVYRILSKKKSDVPPVENENLISESNVNCIGLGAVMCIESPDSSKIIRDKTAVPIKKNGYCSMPPDRSFGQKVMTPCSDGGTFVYPDCEYIVRCLDHGDIVPRPENVAQVSDHTRTVPYLKHGSTAPSLDDGCDVASSSNHLGIDSPLKQDTTPSISDHKCMAPLSELNVDSCSDYQCITTKPIKLPVTRPKENNNSDYVTVTHHTLNVIEQRDKPIQWRNAGAGGHVPF
ncbi:uncharacterized protein LOC117106796 [Anneissia japonica]|uniref:uncharacterized protein LOC117106796 n=1 Tax=Anneissia japonica TaxID=1529436 RepID=UPI001425A9DD|nr:uncharacterized protein LOC117106796 [Anneissia japonica]